MEKQRTVHYIQKFKTDINGSKISKQRYFPHLVFLCGANKDDKEPSERRKAIQIFTSENIKTHIIILAEKVFHIFKEENQRINLLDLENDLAELVDHIVIILESESTFAELGAFTSGKLRSRIIVINDEKFKQEPSFINLGPIDAIKMISSNNALFYDMNTMGKEYGDDTYKIFSDFKNILDQNYKTHRGEFFELKFTNNLNKDSLMYISDLIFIFGPLKHKEVIELIIFFHGKDKYNKVITYLGILNAIGIITRTSNGNYITLVNDTYFRYPLHLTSIISYFRVLRQKEGRYVN